MRNVLVITVVSLALIVPASAQISWRSSISDAVALDFGPEKGRKHSGFGLIHPGTEYGLGEAAGWASKADTTTVKAQRDFGPDALCEDRIVISSPVSLRVDLAPGPFKLWLLLGDPPNPEAPSRISSGGKTIWEQTFTAEEYYSERGLFRLRGAYWTNKSDPFQKFVAPAFREVTAELGSGEQGKRLTFENVTVCACVFFPATEEEAFRKDLASLQKARADELTGRINLKKLNERETFPLTQDEINRKLLVFTHSIETPIYPHTAPPMDNRSLTITLQAARGETISRGVAVEALTDVPDGATLKVTATALQGAGHNIPSEQITIEAVRYSLRATQQEQFEVVPAWLDPVDEVTFEPDAVYSFWVTIHVPLDTPPGPYEGALELASQQAEASANIQIQLVVRSMALPEETEAVIAWPYLDPGAANWNYRYARFDADERRSARLARELKDLRDHGASAAFLPCPQVLGRRADGTLRLDNGLLEAFFTGLTAARFPVTLPVLIDGRQAAAQVRRFLGQPQADEFTATLRVYYREVDQWIVEQRRVGYVVIADLLTPKRTGEQAPSLEEVERLVDDVLSETVLRSVVILGHGPAFIPDDEWLDLIPKFDVVVLPPLKGARSRLEKVRKAGDTALWFGGAVHTRLSFGFYVWMDKAAGGRLGSVYQRHALPFYPFAGPGGQVIPAPDGPISTIEYAIARVGSVDRRYVLALEEEIRLAESSEEEASKKLAQEVKTELEKIRRRRPISLDPDRVVPLTVDVLDKWRGEVAGFVEQLRAARNAPVPQKKAVATEEQPVSPPVSQRAGGPGRPTPVPPPSGLGWRSRMLVAVAVGVALLLGLFLWMKRRGKK